MTHLFKRIRERRATTLVEMMIAFTVFGILIAITVSSFKQSLELQQLSTALLESHDNVGLLFEQISREIRTGNTFTTGQNRLEFEHQDGYRVSYRLQDGVIERRQGSGNFESVSSDNPKVSVDSFITAEKGDSRYPRIVMSITVTVRDKRDNPYTSTIQTSVSPRVYE